MDSLLGPVIMIAIGIVLLVYRNEIGSTTGYSHRGTQIDKPTPGCLLVPFALVLIVGGGGTAD